MNPLILSLSIAMNRSPFSPGQPPPAALARYGSAPGSLLASIADSVINGGGGGGEVPTAVAPGPSGMMTMRRFHSGESNIRPTASPDPYRSRGGDGGGGGGGGSSLIRHSSSPADFFSHLMVNDGGMDHYSLATSGVPTMTNRRLKSQLSFSRQDTLSQISEISIPETGESVGGNSSDETAGNAAKRAYMHTDFPIGSWDESSSIDFSGPPSKRAKDNNGDICIDSQFNLSNMPLEMASMENFLQMQHDSVPFKIRAKRGCATHPRSIAERERRTRISSKLKKVQELVPNMDKQTSIAEMLDLAVEQIKELQSQVQILNQERASCTCAIKEERQL